jgi:uncharacterized membrane protein YebE (DUF533 family)
MSIDEVRQKIARWVFKELRGYDTETFILPTDQDIETFGKAMMIIAKGDGDLAQKEREWILGSLLARGGSESIIEKLSSYEANDNLQEIVASGNFHKKIRPLINEAILACYANDEYHESEKSTVRKFAAQLNVSEDVVTEIELALEEVRAANEKLWATLFPEGRPR